jgi:hypothetical protein
MPGIELAFCQNMTLFSGDEIVQHLDFSITVLQLKNLDKINSFIHCFLIIESLTARYCFLFLKGAY